MLAWSYQIARGSVFLSLTSNDSADFPIKEALRIRKTYLQDMFWNMTSAPLPVAQKSSTEAGKNNSAKLEMTTGWNGDGYVNLLFSISTP